MCSCGTGLTVRQGIISNVVAMESFGAAFPDLYTNVLLTVSMIFQSV